LIDVEALLLQNFLGYDADIERVRKELVTTNDPMSTTDILLKKYAKLYVTAYILD